MSISGVVSLAAQAASLGASGAPLTPAYGLGFRFTVKVDGLELGRWQTCAGLKVDFKPLEVKSGGAYRGASYLAGEATYPRVVLKRATTAAQTRQVHDWLVSRSDKWLDGSGDTSGSAVITVYDSQGRSVLWWQLSGVRPAAWSGPDLDASTSKLATETLELVHEGFVFGSGRPPTGTPAAPARTPLTLAEGGTTVSFPFPPTEISVKKAQHPLPTHETHGSTTAENTPTQAEGVEVGVSSNRSNVTTYELNNMFLQPSSGLAADIAMLTFWATKKKASTGGSEELPKVLLSWGEGFRNLEVRLASLSVTYTRFSDRGAPVRAKVSLKLEEANPGTGERPGARNPSSGGIPGRASHQIVQGDSLAGVSGAAYGRPGAWRRIASANEVEDPLRVAPGTVLLLPAETESADGRPSDEGDPR